MMTRTKEYFFCDADEQMHQSDLVWVSVLVGTGLVGILLTFAGMFLYK